VSFVKGKLHADLEAPETASLLRHLTGGGRFYIELFDVDGNPAGRSGSCPGTDACRRARLELVTRLTETREPCCTVCPRGGKLSALPITHSSAVFGGMLLCEPAAMGQTETLADPLVGTLASLVAKNSFYELEVQSLTTDLAVRYEELALLYEIGEGIPIRSQIPTVIEYVVERLKQVISCDCICWVPEFDGRLQAFWQRPDAPQRLQEAVDAAAAEFHRRVRDKHDVLTVNDPSHDAGTAAASLPGFAISAYPVETAGEYYGTLVLFRGGEFHSGEAMLVAAVTRKSADAIKNTRLYQELNTLFLSTMKTLVRIIEGKDAYTRGHSERVSAFSALLADCMRLPVEEKEALSWSSLLHDIGKIKVPEEILKKPGSLTDEEFAVIQQHPGFGADMLSPIIQLAHCLPDIRHHHERIDGRGYPDRLSGDYIPPRAKIIAVADTFDALTSDRCYRPRFGIDKAFEIIESAAGSQLSPEAAHAMLSNRDTFANCLKANIPAIAEAAKTGGQQ